MLVTMRCGPWNHADKIVLLGDAAHAVVPFYGHGANAALSRRPYAEAVAKAERQDRVLGAVAIAIVLLLLV